MEDKKTGEMLYLLRTEQGIRQETLCYGLCSRSVYSRYESGERHVDKLLFNLLLQRMGKDPGKLSMVLTPQEYRYFRWKKEALDAIAQRDMVLLGQLLERPDSCRSV